MGTSGRTLRIRGIRPGICGSSVGIRNRQVPQSQHLPSQRRWQGLRTKALRSREVGFYKTSTMTSIDASKSNDTRHRDREGTPERSERRR